MKMKYLRSLLLICMILLCSCEQQIDEIVDNVQYISGPSCCTISHNVSWEGMLVVLYESGSKISFTSRLNGTLSFYYESDSSVNHLVIKQNGKVVFNDYTFDRKSVVIHNVQKGDKFTFANKDIENYYHNSDIYIDHIKIIGSNDDDSNQPDWDF